MGFNRMKLDTKLVGSSILVAVFMVLFFTQFLTLLQTASKGLEQVIRAGEAMRLAQDVNVNFQLAVSKGKNVAILKDETNKERDHPLHETGKWTPSANCKGWRPGSGRTGLSQEIGRWHILC